ncbi:MAG: tRNA uridine-5-carboxymethylaminomethyl(34) synthesis GTPase MnmE [Selenomonas sp.]
MPSYQDTIAAIATAPGAAGIGIIRVSGAEALAVADRVFAAASGTPLAKTPGGRAVYGHIVGEHAETIDEAIALVMRAPHSYTREDVVELQCHGGSTVLRRVLGLVLAHGARLSERGEFTKRAFLSGRLDLSQAQAVMDVVSARTDRALSVAESHLAGHFSGRIQAMRDRCLAMIAHLEAAIDFPEDDIDDIAIDEVERGVTDIRTDIRKLLATAHTGRILRDGLLTAIIGKPNVGKSSLLNALLREDRAIVTDIPGTTRDSIEETADIGGVPLRIIDTAGIREATDAVERIGVEKARDYASRAALVLALFDGSQPLTDEDREILSLIEGRQAIVLLNKADLGTVTTAATIRDAFSSLSTVPILSISTKDDRGFDELTAAITRIAGITETPEESYVSGERDAALLHAADDHLRAALETIGRGLSADFISIDLRSAWEKLGEITGETVGEDIIDEIFSRFCIGK